MIKEKIKMASIAGGDVLVQASIGGKKVHLVQQIAVFHCQCGMHYKGKKFPKMVLQ